jgi:DNA-binding CsgD family transcriptional regulator
VQQGSLFSLRYSLIFRVLIYGAALAAMVFLLKFLQYRYLVRDLSIEFYGGLIAVLFVVLGAWVGARLTARKVKIVTAPSAFVRDEENLRQTGISKRELEVLVLMALGNSNQEIAAKLFVSPNTIKTHAASLFVKLDVKRRTQAIQRAKELQILP